MRPVLSSRRGLRVWAGRRGCCIVHHRLPASGLGLAALTGTMSQRFRLVNAPVHVTAQVWLSRRADQPMSNGTSGRWSIHVVSSCTSNPAARSAAREPRRHRTTEVLVRSSPDQYRRAHQRRQQPRGHVNDVGLPAGSAIDPREHPPAPVERQRHRALGHGEHATAVRGAHTRSGRKSLWQIGHASCRGHRAGLVEPAQMSAPATSESARHAQMAVAHGCAYT